LVVFVEGDSTLSGFVAEGKQDADDGEEAEGGGEVEGGVGEALGGGVGVVKEVGVLFYDAVDEEGVVGMDGAAEAEGGVDPGVGEERLALLMGVGEGEECGRLFWVEGESYMVLALLWMLSAGMQQLATKPKKDAVQYQSGPKMYVSV
jgi:hypothetical protein